MALFFEAAVVAAFLGRGLGAGLVMNFEVGLRAAGFSFLIISLMDRPLLAGFWILDFEALVAGFFMGFSSWLEEGVARPVSARGLFFGVTTTDISVEFEGRGMGSGVDSYKYGVVSSESHGLRFT